jgi:hypothetical protein
MPSLRLQVVLVSAVLTVLTLSASAVANGSAPPTAPETPSISQYVETVPTSRGGSSAGVGKPRSRPLPGNVVAKLGTRSDPRTQLLKAVATSSAYGAPQSDLSPFAGERGTPSTAEPKGANALSSAVSAVNDSGDSRMFWLLAGLIVATTTTVWGSARRHRA